MVYRVESWTEYVTRVSRPLTQQQIAQKCGVAQTNVGRWLRGDPGVPRVESVIAFARAFGRPLLEAFIAAGFMTPADAAAVTQLRTPLRDYDTLELIEELRRRAAEGS